MSDDDLRPALEAILFLADAPVAEAQLAELLEADEGTVRRDLERLRDDLEQAGRGIVAREVAGGWRLYTAQHVRDEVEAYVLAGKSGRLSQAALETLAVVAYKQPISRQEVGDVRGVNADGAIRTLVTRGLVEEVGRDDGPGQALLYGTTTSFLEKLGLRSVDDLPPLTDFLPEAPAPDEPGPGRIKEARERLATGADLPSTGRPRWSDDEEETGRSDGIPSDADGSDGEGGGLPPMRARAERREQEGEMEALTDRLERAARAAMSQLKEAVAATEDDASDGADVRETEDDAPDGADVRETEPADGT